MSLSGITSLEKYADRFVSEIPHTPTGRYASIILLRETKSYAIFTTEGGEQQDVEQTQAGFQNGKRADRSVDRVVMFKRKQIAPERRTGKALLRQYDVFPYVILYSKDGQVTQVAYGQEEIAKAQEESKNKQGWELAGPYDDCYLTERLCTHCPDCLIYGYAAVEGEGARKARVMTDSCFSVRDYTTVSERKNFNVIDEKDHTSGTITAYDYVKPDTVFPAVVTTVDLRLDEFVYVLSNVLRTQRYGKEVTRQGEMENHVLAVAFSDVELFANLEFTQALYDALADDELDLAGGHIAVGEFLKRVPEVLKTLTANITGRLQFLINGEILGLKEDEKLPDEWKVDLARVLKRVRELNQDETQLATFLKELNRQSASFVI
ncbi:MAG: type I-D CRISPR-associated protein Cas7/Csc2 [bacterium]